MGEPSEPEPAIRLLAAFSRHSAALDWARDTATTAWGPIALASPVFPFTETDYYRATMGPGLGKIFFVFEQPFDPAELVDAKLQTNTWEQEYAALGRHHEERPLNLDPGYITSAKLVLASTKDFAHRIYLERGIYAEVTLHYQGRGWQHHRFSFPDYQRSDYQAFFTQARDYLRAHKREVRR
ncbi:MAG: DUF4416 family protein [Planctomycetia bacterium]|nr:DUF4416 family protein [Planctomycetia bacterium]